MYYIYTTNIKHLFSDFLNLLENTSFAEYRYVLLTFVSNTYVYRS